MAATIMTPNITRQILQPITAPIQTMFGSGGGGGGGSPLAIKDRAGSTVLDRSASIILSRV